MQDVIIVTGADSGFGSEVTEKLASLGYRVLAVAPREKSLRRLYSFHYNVTPVVADLSSDEGLNTILALLEKKHASVKCLIHSSPRRYPVSKQQQTEPKYSSTLKLTKKLKPFFGHSKVILVDSGLTPIQKTRQQSIFHNLQKAFHGSDVEIDLVNPGPIEAVIAEAVR